MSSYKNTSAWLKTKLPKEPEIAVILGTGLSKSAEAYPILIL